MQLIQTVSLNKEEKQKLINLLRLPQAVWDAYVGSDLDDNLVKDAVVTNFLPKSGAAHGDFIHANIILDKVKGVALTVECEEWKYPGQRNDGLKIIDEAIEVISKGQALFGG